MLMNLFHVDNVWILFLASLVIFLLTFEIGNRIGIAQAGDIDEATKGWIASVDQMILVMLTLLLAFSFGMAEQRFNARKQLVVDEANAIGTTYLRSQWLPEPHRMQITRLLHEYVDIRLPAEPQRLDVEETLREAVARSDRLQDQLWAHAVDIAKKLPSPITALFVASLNDTIDLQGKRIAALQNRVPGIILLLLYVSAGLSALVTGYASGFRNRRSSFAIFALIGLLTLFLTVVVDLDRPQHGFIQVSQQSLKTLQNKINADLTPPEKNRR
jgi:hypothetical protein